MVRNLGAGTPSSSLRLVFSGSKLDDSAKRTQMPTAERLTLSFPQNAVAIVSYSFYRHFEIRILQVLH